MRAFLASEEAGCFHVLTPTHATSARAGRIHWPADPESPPWTLLPSPSFSYAACSNVSLAPLTCSPVSCSAKALKGLPEVNAVLAWRETCGQVH